MVVIKEFYLYIMFKIFEIFIFNTDLNCLMKDNFLVIIISSEY